MSEVAYGGGTVDFQARARHIDYIVPDFPVLNVQSPSLLARLALSGALLLASGCGDSGDRQRPANPYLPIAAATVTTPPGSGDIFLPLGNYALSELGYRSAEYFLTGTAVAFTNLEELGPAGDWTVEPAESADYQTRVVVVRPEDPADFSGTVLVEWLNVSAGFDSAASWNTAHTGILRAGHAWVGVSAQFVGIEGSSSALAPLNLKAVNPARYGALQHPGDSFSYDIFSQAGRAVRDPAGPDVLDGLVAERILAIGESQSASRLVTYINAVHPLYNPYDGYLVHSRFRGAQALAQAPQVPIPTPAVVRTREDLNVPVLVYVTETDLIDLGYINDRQEDSEMFRLWEAAGTAHADYYTAIVGFDDKGEDPFYAVMAEVSTVAAGILECPLPLNAGPHPWTLNAALDALVTWVEEGKAPPSAPRLAVNDSGTALQLDEFGNALGGIRTPHVDAPAARLSGSGQPPGSFCYLFGTTELFDASTMASLYVDRNGYVQAVSMAADEAVVDGFLLQPDAERIKEAAGLQWDRAVP